MSKRRNSEPEPAEGCAGSEAGRKLFRAALVKWFRAEGRKLPWRETRDPYAILVSEMMLQQTQVTTVLPYFARWMERFPDVASLANAPEADVLGLWAGLGYYARARNLHRAAKRIVELGGIFPAEWEAIRALPGIGDYTAGAVATFAFGAAVPAIDANVARVVARLFDIQLPIDSAPGRTKVKEAVESLIPPRDARTFNSALMELGALICRSGRPSCSACPVAEHCLAKEPALLPIKRPRAETSLLQESAVLSIGKKGVILQQQTGRRWRGLWTLPPVSQPPGELLLTLEYPYTRYRVTLQVFLAPSGSQPGVEWADPLSAALPSPHRRALVALRQFWA